MNIVSRRMAALFAIGLIALYPPLLGAFNSSRLFLGIPLLPLYIFAAWSALVLLGFIISRGGKP